MPTNVTTLAEFVKINDKSSADWEANDLVLAGGMLGILHTQASSNGTVHQYQKVTGAPVVGFRQVGSGSDNAPGTSELITQKLYILDATAREDKAAADIYRHGAGAFMERRVMQNLRSGLHVAENQFFYGTASDADGFKGLFENDSLNALADEKVFSSGGAGQVEDIILIRTGEDELSLIANEDNPFDWGDGELIEETIYDATNRPLPGYTAILQSWIGLQFGSKHSVVRMANVDVNDANLEDKIQDALGLFPNDREATHIVMSKAARRGVQKSRTTFNATGAPAPIPTSVDGVPIQVSQALVPAAAIV